MKRRGEPINPAKRQKWRQGNSREASGCIFRAKIAGHFRGADGLEKEQAFVNFCEEEDGEGEPWADEGGGDGEKCEGEAALEGVAERAELESGAVEIWGFRGIASEGAAEGLGCAMKLPNMASAVTCEARDLKGKSGSSGRTQSKNGSGAKSENARISRESHEVLRPRKKRHALSGWPR